MSNSTMTETPFRANSVKVVDQPFPHAIADQFFDPTLFKDLQQQYPDMSIMKAPPGPGWGYSLYQDDVSHEGFLKRSPAWKRVFDYVHSQAFLEFVLTQFADHWKAEGCTINLDKAYYVPFCEERKYKQLMALPAGKLQPHELWCRMDFHQNKSGYYRPVHLDHRRRLMSMLVYFDDQEAIQMEGGELILHPFGMDLRAAHAMGYYHAPKGFSLLRDKLAKTKTLSPHANRMAAFICGKRSWHSVPAIRSAQMPRRHIQISLSSSADAWK
jgi:hypothetical protein